MAFNEIPIPKCPVEELSGGLLTFKSNPLTKGKYVNELYHWLHEVAQGKRAMKAECHKCQVPDGEVTLVLLPAKMTGMCSDNGYKCEFTAGVLHESSRTGEVSGWLVETHENGWFTFRPEPEQDPEDHG